MSIADYIIGVARDIRLRMSASSGKWIDSDNNEVDVTKILKAFFDAGSGKIKVDLPSQTDQLYRLRVSIENPIESNGNLSQVFRIKNVGFTRTN